ncbi:hypothetical protein PSET11_03223 [Arthrobacter ulcerisalmonis]|uniref:VWFA domain-containing protein n=1 Tax=Arthrobacter ulcerisalmonis TaxID=2483813 RepID=A0A3P5XEF4_9MICC|nr:VWA domain-containing protein [Arthrobacter ulcerisalmonis]VDC33097.1 hypothetical protein PSET11_03223 [Arthrobacter ulcerisalmonis]
MSILPILPWWLLLPLLLITVGLIGWQVARVRTVPGVRRTWLLRGVMVLLVFAAAFRPGIGAGEMAAARAADVDVFLLVDTTSSIAAEDYGADQPRLAGVRKDLAALAAELAGARFSLIAFDADATVRLPLTTDAGALATAAEVLVPEVTDYARGSSITAAGPVLTERLRVAHDRHPERLRYVFYFGDGEQTSATRAGALGVDAGLVDGGAVLGYGTSDGGRMREYAGGSAGETAGSYIQDRSAGSEGDAISRLDESALRTIAAELGVPYVHRSSDDPPAPLLSDAQPAAMTVESVTGADQPVRSDLAWLLALAAFGLGLRELVGVTRRLHDTKGEPVEGQP